MFRFFENLVDPFVPYEATDTPPRRLLPFLWDYAQPFRKVFAVSAISSVVAAAAEVALVWYLGRLINLLTATGPAAAWAEHGTEFIIVALLVLFVRPLFQGFDVALLNNTILPNFGTLIRWRAHRHVLRQSVGWFENDFAGRIANRIMQTPPAAGEAVFQAFDAITFSLAYFVGAAILLSDADPRLVLPLLVWLTLYGLLVRWTVLRVGPASKKASDARSAVTGRVVDSYTNIHSVKMFAHHDIEIDYARDAIEHSRETFQQEMRIYTIMDVALTALNGLLIVGVIGWSVALWMNGTASIGVVAATAALVLRLNAMTGWIMWALSSFFRNLGIVAEGMETIAAPIDLVDTVGAGDLGLSEGRIEVQDLVHHYGRAAGGLSGITFEIRPGEKVGLVGRSGAGKSTLVKLLLRFYDAEAGKILIDGQDIKEVSQDSLRAQIGMVQQESALLHRSIRENIRYGDPDATDAEIRAAAKKAEALEFIETLEDQEGNTGFDAQVGERGVKLSGGQRQRIIHCAGCMLERTRRSWFWTRQPRRWTARWRKQSRKRFTA